MPTVPKVIFQSLYDYAFPPSEPGRQWRDRAATEAAARTNAVREAQQARASGNREESNKFNELANAHRKEMEYYNASAEEAIYAHHNPFASNLAQIDLHGLYVAEAEKRARLHLQACKRARLKQTSFITGQGMHSAGGTPVVKPAIAKLLREEGLECSEDPRNPGILIAIISEDGVEPLWTDVGIGLFAALSTISASALWVAGALVKGSIETASSIRAISTMPTAVEHTASANDGADEWEIVSSPPPRSNRRRRDKDVAH